jgi:ACS family tartrate transporter-like MFS transporter
MMSRSQKIQEPPIPMNEQDPTEAVGRTARRRVTRRLLPFLFLLYVVAYIDRSNIGYASLEMTKDLNFSPSVFGFGAGVFFFGYFLLSVPCAILVELRSARKCICSIMVAWGLVASLSGLLQTERQFYIMRFLLGLAEGGFFPAMIVYLSRWFRRQDRGKATAAFLLAIPVSQIVCGPVSAVLLRVHWLGYSGWRWLLVLEGLPAIILGIVTLFYLTDRPADAGWLTMPEKEWLRGELEKYAPKLHSHSLSIFQSFRNRDVLLMTLTLLFFQSTNNGLILWLPKMVQQATGRDASFSAFLTTFVFLCGLPATMLAGWYSDLRNERRAHAAVYCVVAAAALLLSQAGLPLMALLAALSMAVCGIYCFNATFYLLPATFFGRTAAAASLGFITSVGHLGGFLGPYAVGYLNAQSGSYRAGTFFLAGCILTSSMLLRFVRRTAPE